MDGGESVDRVPMTPELFAWVGEYVEKKQLTEAVEMYCQIARRLNGTN